jgi:hypothetical protein
MRGIHRWSMASVWGFVLFVLGIVGYAFGFALILGGLGKIVAPNQIGASVGPHAIFDIGVNNDPTARDVIGWVAGPGGPGRRSIPRRRDDAPPAVDAALRANPETNRASGGGMISRNPRTLGCCTPSSAVHPGSEARKASG